jgi:hypothetical protein
MPARGDVSGELVEQVRAICDRLPEARQEDAWVGTRWRIRKETFAHVVAVADGWPPAYARAVGRRGPVTVLTFQSSGAELEALSNVGEPFFRPPWRPGIVGMVLDGDVAVDWDEVGELVTESYCLLAPARLAAQVVRPENAGDD